MHSSGTGSTTGVDTNPGQRTRHSGSTGIGSTSASEHKQQFATYRTPLLRLSLAKVFLFTILAIK
jgi:hypothetical protein